MRQVILYQEESGAWIADVPSLPGCHSDGATREEALKRVREAIALWIETALEEGEPVPEEKYTAQIVHEFVVLPGD